VDGGWVINGKKRFNSGLHVANWDMIFARTSGNPGDAEGITCFLVPDRCTGLLGRLPVVDVQHAERPRRGDARERARARQRAVRRGRGGLALANTFVHENRIRQAASGVGAAQYCIDESVRYAKERIVFGKPLWHNQAIQFPLAELQTECEMVRQLVYKTAWQLDRGHAMDVTDKVSMCNYRANRLVCEAADQAIQTHGGIGYTRTSRSSTSIATTAATGSPRDPRRSRSGASRG
jgi:alkylation response protein AidB-like acyl-CoA dehydrogenase